MSEEANKCRLGLLGSARLALLASRVGPASVCSRLHSLLKGAPSPASRRGGGTLICTESLTLHMMVEQAPKGGLIDLAKPPSAISSFLRKCFGNKVGEKYIAINGVSLKKSPKPWSLRDYLCNACGKTFTQCHTLHEHRKFHCPNLVTEKKAENPMPKL